MHALSRLSLIVPLAMLGFLLAAAALGATDVDTAQARQDRAGRHRASPPTSPATTTPAKPYVSPVGLPPVEGGQLLAYLKAGKLTPEQCLYFQRGAIAGYAAAIENAAARPELAGVVAQSRELLAAMIGAVSKCPAAPLNPFG